MCKFRNLLPAALTAAALLVAACRPESPTATMAVASLVPAAVTGTQEPAVAPSLTPPAPLPATPTSPVAAATSRGPDLQATDPDGVRLDSGSLQLVEFFRFT